MQEFVTFPLALGDRRPRTLDVGAGAGVRAIEEEDARPDADRELVLSVEVVIETGEEELLDSRVGAVVIAKRIGHR
jgi:hypothetical protein